MSRPTTTMRSRLTLALLLCVAGPAVSGLAHAQGNEPISLATGFTPDPVHARGRTAGTTALHTRAPSCRGFAGGEPDHIVELRSAFGFFRMFLTSAQDLTLAVHAPDGGWRCSTASGDTPALQDGSLSAGRYEIWIGSPTHGSHVEYELSLTEFRSVGAQGDEAARSGGIDVGLDVHAEAGRFRDRRIRRGFLPDPIQNPRAISGGDVDVRLLGANCLGFVQATPSHVMTLRDDFDYLRIQLGGGSAETSLIVRTPGGRYLCSAPEEGNAFIDQDAWAEGVYLVWVGARVEDARPEYAICFTEARLGEASATCESREEE